jgi:large subunit ribosomal protein L6
MITIKGAKGENKRKLFDPKVKIEKKGNSIFVYALNATKKEKKMVRTFGAHIKNMVKGANERFVYKLKVCSGHFPMTVTVTKNEFSVKNFLGESIPRIIKLKQGVDVKLEGDIVTVESTDKELAGQTAADIEQLTRITNRDRRIFQDGIWLIEKFGKLI